MSDPARPPEGDAPFPWAGAAQRQDGSPVTVPAPLRLVRWTHTQVRALTVIARRGADRMLAPGGSAAFDGNARPWNIRMRSVCPKTVLSTLSDPVQGENSDDRAYRLIGIDWNGARLWIRMPSRVCDDWIALRMPDLEIPALPPQFTDAAWEAMVEDALAVLGIARICPGMRVLVDDLPDRHAVYPYAWTLSIRSAGPGPGPVRSVRAELAVDEAGLQALGDLLSRMAAPDDGAASDFLDGLPVPMVAQAGETTLEAGALRGLEAGDVVLFDRCLANLDGDVRLATPDGQGIRVRACESGVSRYVVTQEWSSLLMNDYPSPESDYAPPENGYPPMEDAHPSMETDGPPAHGGFPAEHVDYLQPAGIDAAHAGDASTAGPMPSASLREGPNVDRIPVRLDFDLGEHRMTLGELRRLRPGEFFDLQRPIDAGPVHIRANGTLIGTAELVDIDGRIGARVLTLIPGRGSWG